MTEYAQTSAGDLVCSKCGRTDVHILINGRCVNCNPYARCRKCLVGDYQSRGTASWQNRWVCNNCGDEVSR